MSTTPDTHNFTNEEIVFLLKAVWAALQSPGWTFKNRKDLEKIGEAIFSGKELKDLDDSLYDRIFPHLKTVAIHLGRTLRDTLPDEGPQTQATPGSATPGSATRVEDHPAQTKPVSIAPFTLTPSTGIDADPALRPHTQEGT